MADDKELPQAGPCAVVLVAQGLFLAACGCYGAHAHGWTKQVMHSAYAGLGGMVALATCAAMSVSGSRKLYMIGVHLALVLQAVFVFVFSLQCYKSYGVPAKQDRFPLFVAMDLGSILGLALMVPAEAEEEEERPLSAEAEASGPCPGARSARRSSRTDLGGRSGQGVRASK
eukprot:CAMPEP_0175682604 /NCGR_PEP_ID=MMETSP0097-20121207/25900_1 /TAXON_ID=311494 /ORGANISM="Alexandrium monilatum, Strain CCMP3105" /LENGTH=171 /DNA_ID=CAMNT_0016989493 /DNA_START=51 /DNA_END=562 /DNA_ORIENTATION=+